MAFVKNQNQSVKALRSFLCKENKTEYGIAFQDNPQRKGYTTGEDLRNTFCRKDYYEISNNHGASKHAYILNYIVIKRQLINGWGEDINQLEGEIKFYLQHKNDEWSDVICPILRYGLHRGDRVESTSEKYYNQSYIVSQRAIKTGTASYCCRLAEEMNKNEGYYGEDYFTRYAKIEKFAKHFRLRDVLNNPGNSGVIFDYSKNCYKAVVIDYAL